MFGSIALELLIGLVTVFLLLSTVCSAVVEAISSLLGWRGKMLSKGLDSLLGALPERKDSEEKKNSPKKSDPPDAEKASTLRERFNEHPLIEDLVRDGSKRGPSYIPSDVFADVIIDLLNTKTRTDEHADIRTEGHTDPAWRLATLAESIGRGKAKTAQAQEQQQDDEKEQEQEHVYLALSAMLTQSRNKYPPESPKLVLEAFHQRIEDWFNDTMERASGWYKRRVQLCLLIVASVLVGVINADAIEMGSFLVRSPQQRAALTVAAERFIENQEANKSSTEQARALLKATEEVRLPLGWRLSPSDRKTRPGNQASNLKSSGKESENQPDDQDSNDQTADENPNGLPTKADDEASEANSFDTVTKIGGLGITVFAILVGAPFWFDLLQKLVNLRGSGLRPNAEPPGEDDQEDRKGSKGSPPPAPAGTPDAADDQSPVNCTRVSAEYLASIDTKDAWPTDALAVDARGANQLASFQAHLIMARLSALAYRDHGIAEAVLEKAGLEYLDDAEAGGIRGLVVRINETCIVAYRGTEPHNLDNWITDARIALRDDPAFGGKVHVGFRDALEHVRAELNGLISEAKREAKCEHLWFTGHSLGGALATLHASTAAKEQQNPSIHLCTFGAPLVGDASFAGDIESKFKNKGTLTRYINSRDIVARVPSAVSGYRHFGTPIVLGEGVRVLSNPAEWRRTLSFLIDASEDLRNASREALEDHAIGRYIQRLEALS